jgi:hypothetical protein
MTHHLKRSYSALYANDMIDVKRNGNLLVKLGELAGLLTLEAIWLNMHNYAS